MSAGRTCLLGFLLQFCGAGGLLHAEAIHQAGVVACAPGRCTKVGLDSTDRVPGAHGLARITLTGSGATIDLKLHGMKPAILFGGDYNTYVLWAVSTEDRVENIAEVALNGTDASARGTTSLDTFGLVVTAEPHFLVEKLSSFVVLTTTPQRTDPRVSFRVHEGIYNFERSRLNDVKHAAGPVFTAPQQALTAVRLAQRTGAEEFAKPELMEAERLLDATFQTLHDGGNQTDVEALARRTVRLAVAAQSLALGRAFQNARVE